MHDTTQRRETHHQHPRAHGHWRVPRAHPAHQADLRLLPPVPKGSATRCPPGAPPANSLVHHLLLFISHCFIHRRQLQWGHPDSGQGFGRSLRLLLDLQEGRRAGRGGLRLRRLQWVTHQHGSVCYCCCLTVSDTSCTLPCIFGYRMWHFTIQCIQSTVILQHPLLNSVSSTICFLCCCIFPTSCMVPQSLNSEYEDL